jgi:alkylation response protein AidB-like acyl-CoA dehydrogenase
MQFRFDEDQVAMRDAVRALCEDHFDLAGVAGRDGQAADAAAWMALADLGVLGMLADASGAGIGVVEAAIVFEELGAHLVGGPVLWSVLAAPLVDGVATGDLRVGGVEIGPSLAGPMVVDHGDECDALLVVHGDRVELCTLARPSREPDGPPLDPLTPVGIFESIPSGAVVATGEAVDALRRNGQVLAAALLVGVAQGALDVARAYALEREQFGVPIGSFQAIKHLLADMYVRVELARAATYAAAAVSVDPRAGDVERAASTAKLLAGEAGVANGRTAVQVLGGMGFTWEMLPHYFLKRAWVLEHTFGTAAAHAARIGAAVGVDVASAS